MPVIYESYLCHHGIKGMKWGVRRNRHGSGSLTGRNLKKKIQQDANDIYKSKYETSSAGKAAKGLERMLKAYPELEGYDGGYGSHGKLSKKITDAFSDLAWELDAGETRLRGESRAAAVRKNDPDNPVQRQIDKTAKEISSKMPSGVKVTATDRGYIVTGNHWQDYYDNKHNKANDIIEMVFEENGY